MLARAKDMRKANIFASMPSGPCRGLATGRRKSGGLDMQPERFESLVSLRGPFVSIYIDDSRNTADAEAQLYAK